MMRNVRITVRRIARYTDLMEEYENPIEHACDMEEGQVFLARGWKRPEGFCESAWETISPFVMTLAHGGEDFYSGWMKNKKAAMISCNDGFRPVSFLLEALPSYQYILFDLDGTLTQSEFGIIDSVVYALDKLGIHETDRESLKKFIGPALYESFQKFYDLGPEDADRAVAYYREVYEREGIFHAPVYDGVEEMLRCLSGMGKEFFVVTAKPREMAETVIRHTGLMQYFKAVIGPDRKDRRTDKASLIRMALGLISEQAQDPGAGSAGSAAAQTLMVGDRLYDIEGAKEACVDSVGVLYGYGSREELIHAGATYLVQKPEEITGLIRQSAME